MTLKRFTEKQISVCRCRIRMFKTFLKQQIQIMFSIMIVLLVASAFTASQDDLANKKALVIPVEHKNYRLAVTNNAEFLVLEKGDVLSNNGIIEFIQREAKGVYEIRANKRPLCFDIFRQAIDCNKAGLRNVNKFRVTQGEFGSFICTQSRLNNPGKYKFELCLTYGDVNGEENATDSYLNFTVEHKNKYEMRQQWKIVDLDEIE